MGVASNEMGDPPYDEIPVDQVDNLYDEIHPRSCRDESTVTEDTHTSGGTPQNGALLHIIIHVHVYVCMCTEDIIIYLAGLLQSVYTP